MWGRLRLGLIIGVKLNTPSVVQRAQYVKRKFGYEVIAPQFHRFCSTNSETNKEQLSLDEVVKELCKDDANKEKQLRILMLEVEVMRQDGRKAPSKLTLRNWQYLLQLESRTKRQKYLQFLFKNEKTNENKKAKKAARFLEPRPTKENPDDVTYSLLANAMFLRIRDTSINSFDNFRAHQAAMYGLPVVIDCSYDGDMTPREATNAAKQLTQVFGDNRTHRDPFDIHICNADNNGMVMKQLEVNIPTVNEPWFPLNIHRESYLDLFPKEKLVYLTPHCRDEMVEYDPEAVYIIGCMVDKTNNEPLSLARAKRDGIKMAKLPLDRYVEWAPGSGKCLNINHMLLILLDLKLTGDWEYSLRHVPRRKLMQYKIEHVKKQITKYNPKFVETLTDPALKRKKKLLPRVYAGKLNVKSFFRDDNKY